MIFVALGSYLFFFDVYIIYISFNCPFLSLILNIPAILLIFLPFRCFFFVFIDILYTLSHLPRFLTIFYAKHSFCKVLVEYFTIPLLANPLPFPSYYDACFSCYVLADAINMPENVTRSTRTHTRSIHTHTFVS